MRSPFERSGVLSVRSKAERCRAARRRAGKAPSDQPRWPRCTTRWLVTVRSGAESARHARTRPQVGPARCHRRSRRGSAGPALPVVPPSRTWSVASTIHSEVDTPSKASPVAGTARPRQTATAPYPVAAPANAVLALIAQITLVGRGELISDPITQVAVAATRHTPATAKLLMDTSVGGAASQCHGTMSLPIGEVSVDAGRDQRDSGACPPSPASRARMIAADRSVTCSFVMMFDT